MEIKLSKEESMEIFHGAMCNALGWIQGYGIELKFDLDHYESASKKLKNPCYEDVLQQILEDGNPIIFYDEEGGEDEFPIYLKDIHEKVGNTDAENLLNIINENDDVIDADCVIQTVLFGEIIFG
jgi:hypothetical protein